MATGSDHTALKWIAIIAILGIVCFQLYLGLTVKTIGIPGLLEIEFGESTKSDEESKPASSPLALSTQLLRFGGFYVFNEFEEEDRFLRFYEDGTVIHTYVSVKGATPNQISKWFGREKEDLDKGSYQVSGNSISFQITSQDDQTNEYFTDEYAGSLQSGRVVLDVLPLDYLEHDEATFRFVEVAGWR